MQRGVPPHRIPGLAPPLQRISHITGLDMVSAAHDVSMADKPTFPYLIVILLLFLKSVNPYRDGLGIFFLSLA